ncbi:MAG: TatD family hydrolase [Candidatus Binatia bacterium]
MSAGEPGARSGGCELGSAAGLVDTHCHLTDPRFADDLDAVIARALEAGLTHIVTVGGGGPVEASEQALELARRHSFMRSTAGIHPHDAKDFDAATEARVAALLEQRECTAVGETGLDYFYNHSPVEVQRDSLARHIALARRFDKPIVLHCRDAESDLREVLASESPGGIRGVVHCFTGTYEDARWCLDFGLTISFSGILTFPKSVAMREIAARLPLDRLMVETDSPYLAPAPHRGRRNEPAFVAHTAAHLAEVHGTTLERVVEATGRNARELFDLAV